MDTFFPHATVRAEQDTLLAAIAETIAARGKLVAHAPTGLGKTAAALAPAVAYAREHGKIVLFLTSRLTQHRLAVETVRMMNARHDQEFPVVDLVGKRHFCLQPNLGNLSGKEFAEYCRNMREDGLCEFYERLKTGEETSAATRSALVQLGKRVTPEEVKETCAEYKLCPYEITMLKAKDALVIVTDYSYLFNPSIRDGFFRRIGRTLGDCILILDEGHNIPDRVKDLATERLSNGTIRRALRELERSGEQEHRHHVEQLGELLASLVARGERYLTREELTEGLARICAPEELIIDLERVAAQVREEQKTSSAGAIADFLLAWQGADEGFARIISTQPEQGWQVLYRCLDPAVITQPVFEEAHSAIVMSGTLTPVEMYAELLGLPDAKTLTLVSPFPDENRLNLIIPKTTTKYTSRGKGMYDEIARICGEIIEEVSGNVAVFFPSYALLDEIGTILEDGRRVFREEPNLSKEEREALIDRFRASQLAGAVLLGVMGGSFSEGIDLPGNELRAVIIVGLPLGKPDLETKALIEYYQKKFGKGWEYGYTFPAFTRTLQSAGRCIRTETDKGVIAFLDERYAWQNYARCFPQDWRLKTTLRYREMIREFLRGHDGTA